MSADDKMFYQIIKMYRAQKAFEGAKVVLAQWRLHRKISKRLNLKES